MAPTPPKRGWLLLAAAWTLLALTLPITRDEAYYQFWGRSLAWGYLDHPPLVALWARLSQELGLPLGTGRAFTVLSGLLTAWMLWRLLRLVMRDRQDATLSWWIALFSVAGLGAGLLTTPDAPLALAWVVALHEAAHALLRDPRRWLTAGLAAGVGLLGKYTMVLIAPVFLWALVRARPDQLRSVWPYAGAVVALLVFLPHLTWNAEHRWVAMRFQLDRGLDVVDRPRPEAQSPLPAARSSGSTYPGWHWTRCFKAMGWPRTWPGQSAAAVPAPCDRPYPLLRPRRQADPPPSPPAVPPWARGLQRFAGGQLALFGLMLLPLLWPRRRRRRSRKGIDPLAAPLLHAAAFVPWLFFGGIALFRPVEANWSAVALMTAPALLVAAWRPSRRGVAIAAGCQLVLIAGLAVHARRPWLPLKPDRDRVLQETRGFAPLADRLSRDVKLPLYADSYQLASMLAFYRPDLALGQWPGVTRTSEWLRRDPPRRVPERFALITSRGVPSHIPGYRVSRLEEAKACRDRLLWRRLGKPIPPGYFTGCPVVHRWFLARYERDHSPPVLGKSGRPRNVPSQE